MQKPGDKFHEKKGNEYDPSIKKEEEWINHDTTASFFNIDF
jgi:hypothetical protein